MQVFSRSFICGRFHFYRLQFVILFTLHVSWIGKKPPSPLLGPSAGLWVNTYTAHWFAVTFFDQVRSTSRNPVIPSYKYFRECTCQMRNWSSPIVSGY